MGAAGDCSAPRLVLGLRHGDGKNHLFGLTRGLDRSQLGPLLPLLEHVAPEERAIRSRWQHDAVPPWRRLPAELVCEVRITVIDGGRWLRQPATFVRWRPDRSPEDCGLDQLSE
jgi:ATP-dependent DNA ligase